MAAPPSSILTTSLGNNRWREGLDDDLVVAGGARPSSSHSSTSWLPPTLQGASPHLRRGWGEEGGAPGGAELSCHLGGEGGDGGGGAVEEEGGAGKGGGAGAWGSKVHTALHCTVQHSKQEWSGVAPME